MNGPFVATLKPPTKVTPGKARPEVREEERFAWILDQLDYFYDGFYEGKPSTATARPDLVVIEGLAFSSNTGKATERAGLAWMVRMNLWARKIPYVLVAPTTRAMYGTGKGNADKETVFIETLKRYGDMFDIKNNNEADAVLLWAMAHDYYGEPVVTLPETHRRALKSVVWPDLADK
jgi:hypothetical protein